MTAPYPYPPQGYPAQPQQQFPQQPPAQQFVPQPQFAPGFPAQQGYPPAQFAPPAAPLAQGSIDDFYSQPSTGGGKSLSFAQVGVTHVGIVTRAITAGDIQQQTDTRGNPQTFRDGRPKFVMKVPLQLLQPSPEYPDGLATWFVKGQARDELVRAMSEAGAPAGPPEAGAVIQITHTGTRSAGPGMNPAKLFAIQYRRPDGSAPAAVQQPQAPAQPVAQAPMQPQFQQPQAPAQPSAFTQAVQPELAQLQAQQAAQFAQAGAPAVPQQPAPQQPAPQATGFPPPAQPAAAPAGLQAPANMTPDQAALLARITGQNAAAS